MRRRGAENGQQEADTEAKGTSVEGRKVRGMTAGEGGARQDDESGGLPACVILNDQ